jgi:hypothetical protein
MNCPLRGRFPYVEVLFFWANCARIVSIDGAWVVFGRCLGCVCSSRRGLEFEKLRRKSEKLRRRLCGRACWQKKQAHCDDELAVREGLLRTRRSALFMFAVLRYFRRLRDAVNAKLRFGASASISNLIVVNGVTTCGGVAVRHELICLYEV